MEKLIEKHDITCNEEIDSFTNGDTTIILTGLIVMKEEPKPRQNTGGTMSNRSGNDRSGNDRSGNDQNNSSTSRNRPDKYILDNLSGRRRRILIWPKRIQEFDGKLVNHIVRITRGKVMGVNMQYYFEKDDLGPVEISIVDNSVVEILEHIPPSENITVFKEIALKDAGKYVGENVSITAFLKLKVENVILNNYSYGCGCITDLKHKLIVNVSSYTARNDIPEGSKVTARGLLRSNLNNLILQLSTVDDMTIAGEEIATSKDMKKGFLCLKVEELSNSSNSQSTQRQTPPREHQNNPDSDIHNDSSPKSKFPKLSEFPPLPKKP
ncbi:uncharacterized protein LOC122501549 [Leptopilina heterotoma]|uniref:uncharacterized protein LOC122499083 n=1 Tax=Leptopilina heterotoma TaxID=63436 RepID=UPI001CA7C219|nr:uncharacterized protein LOC122499083 [Leptopilina heterotoma]XP_043465717.1 uncharacterized protein LOC122500718 [Leptopilina heterotoma]XP_043467024.1 uncharacterized protein LOC122501549 [Leptopilina heterotoma]